MANNSSGKNGAVHKEPVKNSLFLFIVVVIIIVGNIDTTSDKAVDTSITNVCAIEVKGMR